MLPDEKGEKTTGRARPGGATLPAADRADALNFRGVPGFRGDALHGVGGFGTLKAISGLVLKKLAAGTAA